MDDRAGFVFQQLLLTSSDEDTSDDENARVRGALRPQGCNGCIFSDFLISVPRPRVHNFIEEVVDQYRESEFRENFRMFRTTFNHILSLTENKIIPEACIGRQQVSAKTQLLFTLWYFSTPDCYRSVCSRFNIGKATALRTVRRVTDAVLSLSSTFIKWPTEDYVETVKNSFQQMGFPNTIGALDGSYIPIPTPKENGLSYICRKGFAAIILQGICDHRMLFTHCYVGEVGSTHDANVFKRSEVYSYVTNRRFEKFPNDTHLVADKAYPCLQTLIVPFKDNGHLTNEQRNFNYLLSKARSVIERAFALLKKRFRCLKYFDIKDIKWACKYIMACCVLHNICILQNDVLQIEANEVLNEYDPDEPVAQDLDRNLHRLGTVKRNNLCEILRQ